MKNLSLLKKSQSMSGASVRRSLVSVAWLRAHVNGKTQAPHNIIPVDASWHMVGTNTPLGQARREFDTERIPGSRYFDLDGVFSDTASTLPHTLVSREQFERGVRQLGIANDSHVILYDRSNTGTFSAARAWWMFRGFGHPPALVSLLDGGFRAWRAAEAELETGAPSASIVESQYVVEKEFDERLYRSFDQSERTK
jgi:thiosulfate/3-mercaptopyruvate sulfurtransferase